MNPALVTLQTEGFDPVADSRLLDNPLAGAQASFLGLVRNDGGSLQALELEHYPGMTEQAIATMVQEAGRRFGLTGAIVRHRVGRLAVGEPIVWVLTAAPHRRAALDGCAFLIDYLKTQAPFWKKEHGAEGSAWVDAREADDAALARWGIERSNVA